VATEQRSVNTAFEIQKSKPFSEILHGERKGKLLQALILCRTVDVSKSS